MSAATTSYYGNQKIYKAATNVAIEQGIAFVRGELSKPDANCRKIFFDLIAQLAKARGETAQLQKTINAEFFGAPRSKRDPHVMNMIQLSEENYGPYVAKLKPRLEKWLKLAGKKFGDKESQVHIRIATQPNEWETITKIIQSHPPKGPVTDVMKYVGEVVEEKIRLTDPELYQKNRDVILFGSMREMKKSSAKEFLGIKVFAKIGEEQVPIGEIFTPILPDGTLGEPAIEYMDHRYIASNLEHIAAIFERIVKGQGDLKSDLAELCYKFPWTLPYERGSAAISEQLQAILATFRNHSFKLPEREMLDMEAFITPYYPNFKEYYMKNVVCQPV